MGTTIHSRTPRIANRMTAAPTDIRADSPGRGRITRTMMPCALSGRDTGRLSARPEYRRCRSGASRHAERPWVSRTLHSTRWFGVQRCRWAQLGHCAPRRGRPARRSRVKDPSTEIGSPQHGDWPPTPTCQPTGTCRTSPPAPPLPYLQTNPVDLLTPVPLGPETAVSSRLAGALRDLWRKWPRR